VEESQDVAAVVVVAAKRKARRNPAFSEKAAWRNVLETAQRIKDLAPRPSKQREHAQHIMEVAADMLDQLATGVHKNPPLTVLSLVNPPRGGKLVSDQLYVIEYKHKENGKNYFHDFRKGTQMLALPDGSILIRRPGARVWGDFPSE
jgi:hypothetical protein